MDRVGATVSQLSQPAKALQPGLASPVLSSALPSPCAPSALGVTFQTLCVCVERPFRPSCFCLKWFCFPAESLEMPGNHLVSLVKAFLAAFVELISCASKVQLESGWNVTSLL